MSEISQMSVSPSQAVEMISMCLEAGLTPFLKGAPGIGKSSIIKEIAKSYNMKLIDHRMSTSESTDMSGLPEFSKTLINGKEVTTSLFAPFTEIFPIKGMPLPEGYDAWLLFLDEFTAADKATQKACYKLVLDRMVGQHELHDQVFIVMASNRSSDGAFTIDMSTAMASRVVHLNLETDYQQWLMDFAIPAKIDLRILAYLNAYPHHLNTFDPKNKDLETFACQRTWAMLDTLIKDRKVEDRLIPLYSGTIGQAIAIPFVQFTKVFDELVPIETILNNPLTADIPKKRDLLWATVSMIISNVKEESLVNICPYIDRLQMPFRLMFYRYVEKLLDNAMSNKAFSAGVISLAKHLRS